MELVCEECSHYLPYMMRGNKLPEGKCTKYQITVSESSECKSERWYHKEDRRSTDMELTRDNLIISLRKCADPYEECEGCIYAEYEDKSTCYHDLLTMTAAFLEETAKGDL